jgi:hypothetical protein
MDTLTRPRKKRSNPLTKEEYATFVKWVDNQPTKYDAALALEVSKPTLDRILLAKSCGHQNIEKVRSVIGQ